MRSTMGLRAVVVVAGLWVALTACGGDDAAVPAAATGTEDPAPAVASEEPAAAPTPYVVDVVAEEHRLELPDEIPSGWVTFRMHNASDSVHFGLIERLPDGRTVEDSKREVVPVFQEAMDLIAEGDTDAGFAKLGELPTWYEDVEFNGGPGLLSPDRTVETTVQLEPGTYAIECYVKGPNGVFHTTNGMISGFTVTEEDSGAPEPASSVAVTVSSERGFEISGQLKPGRQTIAVYFEDQAVYGNGLGHDLHIGQVRSIRGPQDRKDWDPERSGTGVEDDLEKREQIAAWVNWVTDLQTPAPATFFGGVQDMPAGSVAYVTVDLDGGSYVLVSEVDDPDAKGFVQPFGAVSVR